MRGNSFIAQYSVTEAKMSSKRGTWVIVLATIAVVAFVMTAVSGPHTSQVDDASKVSRRLFNVEDFIDRLEHHPLKKNAKSASGDSSPSSTSSDRSGSKLVKFTGPLTGSLPLFGPDVIKGYKENESMFKADLGNAARLYLNGLIAQNNENFFSVGETPATVSPTSGASMIGGTPAAPESASKDVSFATGGGSTSNVNDFGTNNQEMTVDEGDMIKSDGKYSKFVSCSLICICMHTRCCGACQKGITLIHMLV
jgi:hypothetical protein